MRLKNISAAITRHRPRIASPENRMRASVALLLREKAREAEIFFIRRAAHDADPWSGDLGFPGGRVESGEHPAQTAERETLEEVGIDLSEATPLGQLDDLFGAHLPVLVSCYVFSLTDGFTVTLNHEVVDSFWFPLDILCDPERHLLTTVNFRGEPLVRPAIHLLDPPGPVLWGITYRLVSQFLDILGCPLGEP